MTTPIIAPLPGRFTAQQVTAGLADQLARLAYFRLLDHPQADELDTVARYLIGHVGTPEDARDLWATLQPTCEHLWHLITDDWTDDECDELPDEEEDREWFSTERDRMERRREITATRLSYDIEQMVLARRVEAARAARAGRQVVPA